jgi:hypothetical protein
MCDTIWLISVLVAITTRKCQKSSLLGTAVAVQLILPITLTLATDIGDGSIVCMMFTAPDD